MGVLQYSYVSTCPLEQHALMAPTWLAFHKALKTWPFPQVLDQGAERSSL